MSAQKLILVLGGTGFLGKCVVERMLACGYPLRVVTRGGHDWKDSNVSSMRQKNVEVIMGDITDEKVVAKAVENVSGIVNVAGTMQESDEDDFDEIHVQTIEYLTAYGKAAGAQRFVHVSCLGARNDADCRYFLTKYEGEQLVREGPFYWTVLRPSFMFGKRFPLLEYLKPIFTFKLFLPVIGSGTNNIQPIFVEDVADCVVQSIYAKETVGKAFDLPGPDDYSMVELLEMARKSLGIGGVTMNIPSQLSGKTFDILTKALPRSILTNDLAGLMSDDSCSTQKEMLENFQIRNVSLRQYLPQIVQTLE